MAEKGTNAEITAGGLTVGVEWKGENEGVWNALVDAAPFEAGASLWGDEIYFDAPVDTKPDSAKEEVSVGTVAYWHQGNAVCVFWGPTPASAGDEPRAAGPVAPLGLMEEAGRLSSVEAGEVARFVVSG